jgi:hypothetical protein
MNFKNLVATALLHLIDFAVACFPGLCRSNFTSQFPVIDPDFYN